MEVLEERLQEAAAGRAAAAASAAAADEADELSAAQVLHMSRLNVVFMRSSACTSNVYSESSEEGTIQSRFNGQARRTLQCRWEMVGFQPNNMLLTRNVHLM